MPIVPGPVISAKTLTIEKVPAITPNPRPETGEKKKKSGAKIIDKFCILKNYCSTTKQTLIEEKS